MLFVNYVLDLNNGLEQRLFGVVWTITMKCTKLKTPSYWWAMMIKMSAESYIIEDSWMNNYNYESLLYFCVCILYSKCCEIVQNFLFFYYYLHKTTLVHSVFGTCLCIGRAQDRWVLKGKDGCNGKRTHRGSIIRQVMPQWTMNPSSLGEWRRLDKYMKIKKDFQFLF